MADGAGLTLPANNLAETQQHHGQQGRSLYQPSQHELPGASMQSTPALPPRSEFRVRTNSVFSLGQMLAAASRVSKIMLAWSLIVTAAQTIASCCVLALTPVGPNDRPYRTFLVAYMLRSLLAAPFQVVRRLRPRRRLRQMGTHFAENDPEVQEPPAELAPTQRGRDVANGERFSPTSTSAATAQVSPSSPVVTPELQGVEWSNDTHERFARARSIIDLTGNVLVIWGTYLLFQSPIGVSQPVWDLTLAWVILGYTVVMIPVLLSAAVIFCLPCAMVAMRLMRLGEFAGTGADESEIKKIPVVKYRRMPPAANVLAIDSRSSGDLVNARLQRPKAKWWRRLASSLSKKKNTLGGRFEETEENSLTLPDEDAVCVICLAEYEDGEGLRRLPCDHHFHMGCADEWLRLNRTCPLCKRDIQLSPDEQATRVVGQPAGPAGSVVGQIVW